MICYTYIKSLAYMIKANQERSWDPVLQTAGSVQAKSWRRQSWGSHAQAWESLAAKEGKLQDAL